MTTTKLITNGVLIYTLFINNKHALIMYKSIVRFDGGKNNPSFVLLIFQYLHFISLRYTFIYKHPVSSLVFPLILNSHRSSLIHLFCLMYTHLHIEKYHAHHFRYNNKYTKVECLQANMMIEKSRVVNLRVDC